jgi:hypothetical protein
MLRVILPASLLATALIANVLLAQAEAEPRSAPDTTVLDQKKWKQVDASVKRGLERLISQQNEDGSFETIELGQPAITSFCLMAFLAQGESPTNGKYQKQLSKAVDYIVDPEKVASVTKIFLVLAGRNFHAANTGGRVLDRAI